jgi:opacity protein-like surface antigen
MRWRRVIVIFAVSLTPAVLVDGAMTVSQEVDAQYVYVGGAGTRGAGLDLGSVDESSADVKYVISPQITKDLLLRLGAEWQRFSFGTPNRSPVPDTLQQVSAVLGFDYQLADQWLLRMETQPGFYSNSSDIRWDVVDAPVVLGAAYLKNEDLQWFFGLRVDGRSQYPALPVAGVRWKFSDEWTLNLVLPNPRLEYDANERLQFYAGAGVDAGTFRVDKNFGNSSGLQELNNAMVDYLEIRVGAGCSWKIHPAVTLEAGAGYLPYRSWDFFGRDIEFRSHNAAYGQVACHARF